MNLPLIAIRELTPLAYGAISWYWNGELLSQIHIG